MKSLCRYQRRAAQWQQIAAELGATIVRLEARLAALEWERDVAQGAYRACDAERRDLITWRTTHLAAHAPPDAATGAG